MADSSPRVLVVEDDEPLPVAVAEGLPTAGFDVEVALDGASGLAMARERRFDLIVLDLLLPVVDGFRFCDLLRQAGDWTPVLVLTAKQGELDETGALEAGADDFSDQAILVLGAGRQTPVPAAPPPPGAPSVHGRR